MGRIADFNFPYPAPLGWKSGLGKNLIVVGLPADMPCTSGFHQIHVFVCLFFDQNDCLSHILIVTQQHFTKAQKTSLSYTTYYYFIFVL